MKLFYFFVIFSVVCLTNCQKPNIEKIKFIKENQYKTNQKVLAGTFLLYKKKTESTIPEFLKEEITLDEKDFEEKEENKEEENDF